jgi:hypothetical protein
MLLFKAVRHPVKIECQNYFKDVCVSQWCPSVRNESCPFSLFRLLDVILI